jgi:hypothetical protein
MILKRTEKFYGWKMVGLLWLVTSNARSRFVWRTGGNSAMILSTGMGRSVFGAGYNCVFAFQGSQTFCREGNHNTA